MNHFHIIIKSLAQRHIPFSSSERTSVFQGDCTRKGKHKASEKIESIYSCVFKVFLVLRRLTTANRYCNQYRFIISKLIPPPNELHYPLLQVQDAIKITGKHSTMNGIRYISIFLLFCFAWASEGRCQQRPDSSSRLSLKQSIDYALQHQGNVINAQYEVKKAGAKVNEITGIGLPQLNASGNVQDFFELPTTLIPAQFFGGPPGDFIPLKFGTQYNTGGELDASQLLFDGTYITGLEAAKTYRELSQKSLVQTTIQTVSLVSKAYYTVLVTNWKLQMVEADAARLKALLDETEAMYKNGVAEKLDWERIKVNYNNITTQIQNTQRLVRLSNKLLKFQMGMPQTDSLTLTDSLKSIPIVPDLESDSAFNPSNRIEYSMAQTQIRANQLMLQKDRYSNLPSLLLIGSVSEQTYGEKLEFNGTWYPTGIVGLKVNLPLFSGFQRANRIQQDKIGLLESENNLNTIRQSIALDIANSATNFSNALSDLKNQQANMDLAQSVEHDSKIKYESGTGSYLEVVDAETSLTEAESEYYSALFSALVAKVDYEQAKGTLYKK
ncbi:MAG: TolC family protein [Bacteroidia bacterium]|nr:TolC family protein [Bacteroidia bacterium]